MKKKLIKKLFVKMFTKKIYEKVYKIFHFQKVVKFPITVKIMFTLAKELIKRTLLKLKVDNDISRLKFVQKNA